ncbi:DUF6221 family protein [Streptomyces sp. NPDC005349]|uniref:DUF6221 family protein n=1 Tax=Streptomyces sp. NPDC005349 TaxID=3157037 RepID=UPI0033ABF1FB
MIDGLVQWFGEQLDEDERIARAAHEPNWSTDGRRGVYYGVEDSWMTDALTTADADHIAAHDPARVLREIDAKREIIRQADLYLCDSDPGCGYRTKHGHSVLRLLALPYADRPGYREEWRP